MVKVSNGDTKMISTLRLLLFQLNTHNNIYSWIK